MKGDALRLDPAQIAQHQANAAVEKGELAQPVLESRKVELRVTERLRARQKGDLGAGSQALARGTRRPGRRRADFGERRFGHAIAEPHEPFRPAAENAHIKPGGEAVDDRNANTVQPARYFIGALGELTA